jgi:hypothetical protein
MDTHGMIRGVEKPIISNAAQLNSGKLRPRTRIAPHRHLIARNLPIGARARWTKSPLLQRWYDSAADVYTN